MDTVSDIENLEMQKSNFVFWLRIFDSETEVPNFFFYFYLDNWDNKLLRPLSDWSSVL